MVYPMLINTNNKLEIKYKQQVTINKIKTGKGYEYKEITVPTELIRYYKSIINEDVKEFYYIICSYNNVTKSFITPLEVEEDTDISLLFPNAEEIVTPDRVIKIPVKIHGNVNKNPRYYFRLNKKFEISEDYVIFNINPYLEDPVSKTFGLVNVENLIL